MPQIVLDPADITTTGTWKSPSVIPRRIRNFGRFPNVDDWQPGDLILFSAIKPGFMSRQIIEAQKRADYHEDDARWHHAAIFAGRTHICEAVPAGVTHREIYDYVSTHLIRVRRAPDLTRDQGWQLLVHAMVHIGKRYSFTSAAKLGVMSFRRFGARTDTRPPKGMMVCSQLFVDAYSMLTGEVLWEPQAVETPAFLSATPKLRDVSTHWCEITRQ
jgi:hypothetical protein